MSGLYPDLSHLREEDRAAYLRAQRPRHHSCCHHSSSGSESDEEAPSPCKMCSHHCKRCWKSNQRENDADGEGNSEVKCHCRAPSAPAEEDIRHPEAAGWSRKCESEGCGGSFSSKYCGVCRRPDSPPGPGRQCDVEDCGGPFSPKYCGLCRRPDSDGFYGDRDDFHEYSFEIGEEGSAYGRNYVMERERLDDVIVDLERHRGLGPQWWSASQHHVIPPHHTDLYSWVPMANGDVPHNAVKVGRDQDGGYIYVGRAKHEGDLIPAKVCPSHGGAFVPYGGGEHSKFEYEVLVSDNSRVAWQEASKGHVHPHALVAGYTSGGECLYVGRVLHNGVMTPGKIHHSHGTMYISWAGQEIPHAEYEVLVVIPN